MKNIPSRIFVVIDRYELNFGGNMGERCIQLAVGGADIHGASGMIGYDSTTGRWLVGEKNGVREISEEEAFNQLVKAYEDSTPLRIWYVQTWRRLRKDGNNGR